MNCPARFEGTVVVVHCSLDANDEHKRHRSKDGSVAWTDKADDAVPAPENPFLIDHQGTLSTVFNKRGKPVAKFTQEHPQGNFDAAEAEARRLSRPYTSQYAEGFYDAATTAILHLRKISQDNQYPETYRVQVGGLADEFAEMFQIEV